MCKRAESQLLDLCGAQIQRLIPGDGLPAGWCFQLRAGDAMRALDPSDMILEFGAGKPGGKRVVGIASDLYPAIRRVTDDDRTGIRAIHRTCRESTLFFLFACRHQW